MLPFTQNMYPCSSINYQKNVTMPTGVIKATPTKMDKNIYHRDTDRTVIKHVSADSDGVPAPATNHNSPIGMQIGLPPPELHPAFRLYPYSQLPVIDPSYLSAYYKTIAPSSSLPGMMILPSNFIPVSLPSSAIDKSINGLHREQNESIGICNS